ncbi:hypothetical protein CIPAW_01G257100 [Carya illinoinensis]|uniref:Uncharacterized protein n=1 Tax=Carya illinoinensis TaxID=32201 RepID=A0A8T1RUD2_CARIL|nr:hypothetical protein CIPAW_01G257100 [Carya illinoinensis]
MAIKRNPKRLKDFAPRFTKGEVRRCEFFVWAEYFTC